MAVELLAIKIRNSNIKGITTPRNEQEAEIKIKQLADDTTLFLKDSKDMIEATALLRRFQSFSGLKLNTNKTKALQLGKNKNKQNVPFATVNRIKILGIYFEAHRMARNIEDNWKSRIECMQRMIVNWSKRDLSIHGKIIVTKTFLISQISYVMQSVGIPDIVLNKINTMLYKFIWQRKHSNKKAFEKVKRKVMESDIEMGGLKMINICNLQKLFYLQWAGKFSAKTDENWSFIPRWDLRKLIDRNGCFFINSNSKEIEHINDLENDFWKEVMITYLNNKKVSEVEVNQSNILDQPLFYNDHIRFKGKTLYFTKWKEKGIEYIKHVVNTKEKRLLTLAEIESLLGHKTAMTLFEHNALQNAIPTTWFNLLGRNNLTNNEQTTSREGTLFNTKPKEIRRLLNKMNPTTVTPTGTEFWRRTLNFDLSQIIWLIPKTCTNEIRLRELQWKINHNIYPTNILLQKMKVTETNKCDVCTEEIDYIEHFFFHCPQVKYFWNNIESLISNEISERTRFSVTDVLFGFVRPHIGKQQHAAINHILLVGKMCISIARKTNILSALQMLFDHHFELRGKYIQFSQ